MKSGTFLLIIRRGRVNSAISSLSNQFPKEAIRFRSNADTL